MTPDPINYALMIVLRTLDNVYALHTPERPEDEDDPGICMECRVDFPCITQDLILEGLADASVVMKNAFGVESQQPSS